MRNDKQRQPAPNMNLGAVQRLLNVVETPKVTNRLQSVALIAVSAVCLVQGGAILAMLPLKERIPYAVEVETATGNVAVSDRLAQKFEVQETNIRYFLGRWSENLLSVDENSRGVRLPASYAMLKGDALAEWQRYVTTQGGPLQILAENPEYRQRAELISITFLSDKSAMIRVKLTNANGEERRVQVNVTYVLVPPTSDEEVQRNPIGLWITTFGVQNELA